MHKKILNFISTLILAIVLSVILPWWGIMLAAIITGFLIPLKGASVFFIPFLSVFLFWLVYTFWLSSSNDYTLANKIAVLLPLNGNAFLLIFVTALIGGIAAGISGIFGKQLKDLLTS